MQVLAFFLFARFDRKNKMYEQRQYCTRKNIEDNISILMIVN